MLKRLTTLSIFFILVLIFFVSMLGIDEAQAGANPPTYFWYFSKRNHFTAHWKDVDQPFGWSTKHFNFRYRKQGDTSWTELTDNVSRLKNGTANVTISSLTPSTTYEFGVRTVAESIIGTTAHSDWSTTQTATTAANQAPTTVGTIPDQTLVERSGFIVYVADHFDDPDDDPLIYSATSSDTTIATVSVTGAMVSVSTKTPGSVTISVTATDTYDATATQSIAVTATLNQAPEPVGTILNQTLKVGSTDFTSLTPPPRSTIDVSWSFNDPDDHPLTYSATSSDTSIATVNVSFGSYLQTTAVAAGSATITVTASDSLGATGTQTFTVTVQPNSAPTTVGSIPTQTVSTSGSAATVDVSSYFSDPDKNPLTYSATSSDTSKATVSISEATLTITAVVAGSATITVTATDTANATATQTFSATVITNNAPVRVGSIPTQTVSVTETAPTMDVSPYFSDPDGNPLTYSATSSNTNRATVSLSDATLTITAVATGWTTITLNATDTYNAGATQTFSVNVISNRAPISVTIPSQSVRVGGTDTTVDVSPYFSDPDGNSLTYSATSSNTSKATVSVSGTILTLTAVAAGSATTRVTATDDYNASTTRSFSVTVLASDTVTRVGSIPKQTLSLSGTTTAIIDVSSYFSGPDGETLTYSATSSNTSRATVSLSSATLTITAVAAGSSTIKVKATSTNNASATQSFSVRVYSNRAPTTVGTIPALSINNAWVDQFGISSYFSDPDGNALTYSASSSNTNVAEAGISSTATSTLLVAANGVGTATITVTATDPSNATATQSFSVTVTAQQADAVSGLSTTEQLLLGRLLTYDTLIFNELHNGSGDANDWLELRNVSPIDIPLNNWQLTVQTGSGAAVIAFPTGTVIPAGDVLLLTNTKLTTSSVVAESFVLPETDFALILRSPTAFGDIAGNYFQDGRERPETAPELTADTVWERVQATTSGYRAEAWVVSTHRNGLGSPGYQPSAVAGDLNHDGVVNILDLVLVASQFGTTGITAADLNGDGTVNIQDLVLVANTLGNAAAAPSAKQLSAAVVNNWLQLAQQNTADAVTTSLPEGLSYARGIQVLEQLADELTPDTTALLANYPNPFNPETWIPYQLSKAADVTVTIYASDGTVVRTLAFGHQDAGMYKNRSQAAYWDGTNELGETVASGLYFYTLTAGEFTATRKMLILK